jgi:hypothetical protein
MIVFTALLVLCFVGVVIGMLTDMCLFFKEVYNDGSKKNQGFKGRRIFHIKTGGISPRKPCMDTGELRA